MEVSEFDWPEIRFRGVEVEVAAQWAGLREVQPLFSRTPYEDWCRLFRWECEQSAELEWMDAGFARCRPSELPAVTRCLENLTALTNERFRVFIARVLEAQPVDAIDLIEIEGVQAASEDDAGRLCGFRTDV